MKKVEIVLGSIAFTGFLMRLFSIPFAGALIVLSLTALSTMYMYFTFALLNQIRLRDIFKKKSYQDIDPLRIIGGVVTGFALSTLVVGYLFRLLLWPGATAMLGISLLGLAVIFLVGALKYRETKATYYLILFKRIVIYTSIGIPLLLISSDKFLEFYYRDHPSYVEARKNYEANPDNQELEEIMMAEGEKMDKLKAK